MARFVKIALVSSALLAVLAVVAIGLLLYFFDPCVNEIVAEHVAPDGRLKLVVFQRNCGATTGFSTQASLVERDDVLPLHDGNLFVADCDHGYAPAGPGGGPELRVRWEGSHRLVIQRHERARVFESVPYLDGVDVRYETFSDR